jgi:hypothetical protein
VSVRACLCVPVWVCSACAHARARECGRGQKTDLRPMVLQPFPGVAVCYDALGLAYAHDHQQHDLPAHESKEHSSSSALAVDAQRTLP